MHKFKITMNGHTGFGVHTIEADNFAIEGGHLVLSIIEVTKVTSAMGIEYDNKTKHIVAAFAPNTWVSVEKIGESNGT